MLEFFVKHKQQVEFTKRMPIPACINEKNVDNKQSKETYGQTRGLINSSLSLLFNFKGMVCDSFIGFGRVFTTEFTSAGTLTTLP